VSCSDIVEPPQSSDLITIFQKGTLEEKKENLKTLVKLINSDENYPRLIMPVLTNLQQLQDHDIKKILFLYWEIIEKTNYDGTIKEELILACNALRKDLLSPNEYIRGRTLRLISKIHLKSILENLMEAIGQNLTHRHFYVRRNAIMCIYNIFLNTGMELVEDFIDEIEKLCTTESDLSTKRNAFILLFHLSQEKALNFLKMLMAASEDDPIYEMGDIFQLAILEMLRRLCIVEPA
jgi:coatomer subunit beta